MRRRSLSVIAAAGLLGGCMMVPMMPIMMGGSEGHGGGGGHGTQVPAQAVFPETAAERSGAERCAFPIARVIVTEDGEGSSRALRDRQAQFGIPPLVRTARHLAGSSGCFRVLDADPLLHSLPGAVQPELLLRARLVSLEPLEQSGIERALHGARRRVGGLLGGAGKVAEGEVLGAAEIGLALVCPLERRVAFEVMGASDPSAGTHEARHGSEASAATVNQERIVLAYVRAQNAALGFLRSNPKPCGEAIR